MGITLHINMPGWRAHLDQFVAQVPDCVPVVKGNGYGFGIDRLVREIQRMGAGTVAVGLPSEVAPVRAAGFDGDILVLQPWRPGEPTGEESGTGLIRIVSRLEDARALAERGAPAWPMLIELDTPMRRYGVAQDDIAATAEALEGFDVRGWTLHLPLPRAGVDQVGMARGLTRTALQVASVPGRVWVSHMTAAQIGQLGGDVSLRVGTALWLGAPATQRMSSVVLDVHRVRRGERIGYHQRPMPRDGFVLMIAGGTSNGVGLEFSPNQRPLAQGGLRTRARTLLAGVTGTAGWSRSPFTVAGAKRWLVESPHMEASMVFLPSHVTPPAVGSSVPVRLSYTTAQFDETLEEEW